MYFFPTLYKDQTDDGSSELFVRVAEYKPSKKIGSATKWKLQKVAKVAPFIYKPIGETFFDIGDMYSRVRR